MRIKGFEALSKQLNDLMKKIPEMQKEIVAGIEQNVKDAADVAVLAAREATPHDGDGKKRGYNTITGELEAHWSWRFIRQDSYNKHNFGTLYIYNDTSYASFVQFGHNMHKHFVPWLYIDGCGTISYETNHNLPMFGLVVGTKTKYVDGRDMIGPAEKAFNETFTKLTQDLLNEVLQRMGEK